jgi:hypothetical protein
MVKPLDKEKASAVLGFPEIVRYEYRCRLCHLAKSADYGLARLIHELQRTKAGQMPNTEISKQINLLLERHGHKALDDRAVANHFKTHVDFSKVIEEVAKIHENVVPPPSIIELSRAYLTEDEDALLKQASGDGALGKNNSDYHRMWELFEKLYRRVDAVDKDPSAFIGEDGGPNGYKLVMWAKLVAECRQLLVALNNMRNQDRLVLGLLEGHTKRIMMSLFDPLNDMLRSTAESLREARKNGDAGKAIDEALEEIAGVQQNSVKLFSNAASDALRQAKEEYKLH